MKYALMILLAVPGVAQAQSNGCGPQTVSAANARFQTVGLIFGRGRNSNCGPNGCGQVSQDIRFSQQTSQGAPVTPRNEVRMRYEQSFERNSGSGASCEDGKCEEAAALKEALRTLQEQNSQLHEMKKEVETLKAQREVTETSYWGGPQFQRSYSMEYESTGYGTAGWAGSRAARRAMAGYGYPLKQPATPVRDFIQGGRANAAAQRAERQMYNAMTAPLRSPYWGY